jgi:hypothetical protein
VKVERDRATFELGSGVEEAAGVLAKLVEWRVPVASFAPVAVNLEEAYLRADIGQVD